MAIYIDLDIKPEDVCSRHCIFCKYDQLTDQYACVLFEDTLDQEGINACIEEKELYANCPVKRV